MTKARDDTCDIISFNVRRRGITKIILSAVARVEPYARDARVVCGAYEPSFPRVISRRVTRWGSLTCVSCAPLLYATSSCNSDSVASRRRRNEGKSFERPLSSFPVRANVSDYNAQCNVKQTKE